MYKVTKRSVKFASVLQRLLMAIISRKLSDSSLRSLSISYVDLSPDLRNAKVFISIPFGADNPESLIVKLNEQMSFIRKELARSSEFRYLPKLSFHLDHFLDQAAQLTQLIEQHSS